jgi:predicted TIM-barrel fold metal-dependent hydrolase
LDLRERRVRELPGRLIGRLAHPKTTVRWRLTVLYGGLVWADQLERAATLVGDAPGVPVVLEHLGLPDPARDPGLRGWRAAVAALAELPHAHVKLSAFSLLGPRKVERVRPVLAELLELFGPQRCMFGSNFPVERLAGDFESLYGLVLAALDGLSAQELADVLSETARRFYRLSA